MQDLLIRHAAERVGISTITFRHQSFADALALIQRIGAAEIDLGAIPAVVDHVPVPFQGKPQDYVSVLESHGLRSGAINCDVGDLNDPDLSESNLLRVARPLIELAAATGSDLIVPCGRADWEPFVDEETDLAILAGNLQILAGLCSNSGVRLLVEVLHHGRFIHNLRRADMLLDNLGADVFGLLLDVSHVVASEEDVVAWARLRTKRIERVHLRDAVPGNINVGIGRGNVNFAGVIGELEAGGFAGSYILELETHDIAEHDREADAHRSRAAIIEMLSVAIMRSGT